MLNHTLDRLVRPYITILGRTLPAFQVCGLIGLALAITLAMSLVIYRGLEPAVMALLVGTSVLTFFALAFVTKIVTGEEELVYYHHEIAVMTVAALTLWLLHRPVLAYLDATILGIGAFLACGRVGCLMAGCCHGRPHRWGVCYGPQHADHGCPPYYLGIRLFPTQALESAWVFFIVIVGTLMVLRGQPPGVALAWYIVAYDVGRFLLEFARGDTSRPYHLGFSEAQWISLALTWLIVGIEALGALAVQPWRLGAALGITAVMALVALRRSGQDPIERQALWPQHVREVAHALDEAGRPHTVAEPVRVVPTSLGVQISGGATHEMTYYTLSAGRRTLTDGAARRLADLIALLRHAPAAREVQRGGHGVVHVLIRET